MVLLLSVGMAVPPAAVTHISQEKRRGTFSANFSLKGEALGGDLRLVQ
jgi:hypothetical protein